MKLVLDLIQCLCINKDVPNCSLRQITKALPSHMDFFLQLKKSMHLKEESLNIFISNSPHNIQTQALLSPTTLSKCNSKLTVVGVGELLALQLT